MLSVSSCASAAARRAAVRAVAGAFLFLVVVLPAKALAPFVLVPPALEVLSGVMTFKNFLMASFGAHAAVALLWGNKDGSSNPATSSTGSQITVYIDPKKPLVAPSGWSQAPEGTSNSGTNPQPSPPQNVQPVSGWHQSGSTKVVSTLDGEIVAVCGPLSGTEHVAGHIYDGQGVFKQGGNVITPTTSTSGLVYLACTSKRASDGSTNDEVKASYEYKSSCPAGYVAEGSGCKLSDATVVKKPTDQSCSIVRNGNTFEADSKDPDCSTMAATMPTPSTIQLKKNNELLKATINADGSVTTTMTAPDANGNTVTTIVNFAPPVSTMGMPATGISESTTQGSGDLNDPSKTVQQVEVKFPDDYARQNTQAQIQQNTGEIRDELKRSGPDISAAQQAYDNDKASIENTLSTSATGWFQDFRNKWFSFAPVIEQAECTAYSGNFKGHAFSMDWCPAVRVIRSVLGLLAYFFTLFALYKIALGTRYA